MTDRFAGSASLPQVDGARPTPGVSMSAPFRAWQPVLDPAERTEALTVVAEIADALAELPHDEASLAGGSAGRAVLHARLADADTDQRDAALTCLRHATPSLRTRGGPSSLHVGAAGIGWVLTHVRGSLLDARDRCTGLDRALLRLLDRQPWSGHVDLMRGLVGIGVYALERLESPVGPTLLERVVTRLADTAVRDGDDVYWWTPPERLPDLVRQRCPQGHVNLGIAHGVPGMIAMLGATCAAGVAPATARPLLDGAVRWLVRDGAAGEILPAWRSPDQQPELARTAWCYGEPGVAAALLLAARAVAEPAWEDTARRLARRATTRSIEDSGVVDAGLCHGAAGLGLVFARLHQATGEQQFQDAARYWFSHVLDLRVPGSGVAGYTAADVDGPVSDPSLLTGATGIALALHAAATDREPTWDRILLLSTAAHDATATPISASPWPGSQTHDGRHTTMH